MVDLKTHTAPATLHEDSNVVVSPTWQSMLLSCLISPSWPINRACVHFSNIETSTFSCESSHSSSNQLPGAIASFFTRFPASVQPGPFPQTSASPQPFTSQVPGPPLWRGVGGTDCQLGALSSSPTPPTVKLQSSVLFGLVFPMARKEK